MNRKASESVGTPVSVAPANIANAPLSREAEQLPPIQRLQDSLFVFVGVLSLDGTLVEANAAPLLRAGLQRHEVIGKKFWDTPWWSHNPTIQQQLRQAFDAAVQGQTLRYDVKVQVAQGELIWIDFMLAPLRDDQGTLTHLIPSGVDITGRRRTEEQLQASVERFRQLADSMPQLVWTAPPSGVPDYYNRRADEYAGIEQTPKGTWEWQPVVHPDDLQSTIDTWQTAVRTGQTYQIEHRVRMRDGQYRWHLSRGIPTRDQQGHIVRWFGTATDIDDHRQTQSALEASERRYRQIIESTHLGVWLIDSQGKTQFINEQMATMLGYEPREMLGRSAFDFVFPEDMSEGQQKFQERLQSPGRRLLEFRYRRKDGGECWTLVTSSNVLDDQGQCIGVLGMFTDVTHQHHVEEQLRQSQHRLAVAQRAGRIGLFDWDLLTGKIVWTAELEQLFGLEPGQFDGTFETWTRFVHPEDLVRVKEDCQRLFDDKRTEGVLTFRIHRTDGAMRWIEARVQIIYDDQGNPARMVGTNLDITERVNFEEELRRINATLEERVATRTAQLRAMSSELARAESAERRRLAHLLHDDLQQILVAAKMNVQSAAVETPPDSPIHRRLEQVQNWLTESIALSRSLSIELCPPVLQDGDLPAALQWLSRHMFQRHQLTVHVNAMPSLPTLTIDERTLLFQAVRELLFNIVKHAGVSQATVSLRSLPRAISILVEDRGRGFDPQTLRKTKVEQSHFGLLNVRERLEWIGGSMNIESSLDQGTRIELTLPLEQSQTMDQGPLTSPNEPSPNPEQRVSESGSSVIRVLLADDHQLMRDGLAMMIETAPDIKVIGKAADGEEAIERARSLNPDVIIMDMSMPRLNGIEATRRICQEKPSSKVIGLSMHERSDMERQMVAAGAVGYLPKDGPIEGLIEAIRMHAHSPGI